MKTRLILGMSVVVTLFCIASKCRRSENCPDGSHKFLYLKNNSKRAIAWQRMTKKDTVWIPNGEVLDSSHYRILPGETIEFGTRRGQCWESNFSHDGSSNYYYFFDYDTVTALGWDKIKGTNRGLLKIQEYNLQILQDNNFTLTYP